MLTTEYFVQCVEYLDYIHIMLAVRDSRLWIACFKG